MFGFDNTRDNGSQGYDQSGGSVPPQNDQMSTPPPMMPGTDITPPVLPPQPQANDPMVLPQNPANDSSDTNNAPADLLAIKQDALQKLSPLVNHLDQSPEEKFKTTMMMIQASDDQSLVATAYEAANAIPDEKARAQALLDIVNEINYFTQHNS